MKYRQMDHRLEQFVGPEDKTQEVPFNMLAAEGPPQVLVIVGNVLQDGIHSIFLTMSSRSSRVGFEANAADCHLLFLGDSDEVLISHPLSRTPCTLGAYPKVLQLALNKFLCGKHSLFVVWDGCIGR